MTNPKLIKVNIGSGPHGLPDWINLDWGILPLLSKITWLRHSLINTGLLSRNYHKDWPSNLRLWDCRRRLPFENGSVDFIYTSHFLEHLPRYQARKVLVECKRVLRPSGILRVSVPDVRLLAEKYLQGEKQLFTLESPDLESRRLRNLTDLFVEEFYGHDTSFQPTFVQSVQRRFIRGHLWMYDYESLSDLLHTAGFTVVRRCEPGHGEVPAIEFLDIHRHFSLFVETSVG